jgi:hypothetical protein
MSMTYLLKRPINKEDTNGNLKQIGYEYKYFSSQYNNRLFEYPQTIDNDKTKNEALRQVQGLIKPEIVERPSTEWKFVRYLHYEISVFRLQSTIGYAVSLPLHFYEDSNKKNVIKFENLKDNLCFWR